MYIQYVDNFLAQHSGHRERGTSCNKTNWSEMALQRTSLGYLRTWRNSVGALPETVCMRSAHDVNVENWDHCVPSSWRSWHVSWMWFPCFLGLNLVPRVSVSFRSVGRKEERPWERDWMRPFVALHFRPRWQTCLTPFDQLYVLLFLPMKMRCGRVLRDYFTRGRDGVCQLKARNLSIVTYIVRVFCRIFLHVPKHIYSCLWSLILLVRSFVKCSVLYYVVCRNGVSNLYALAQVY